MQALLGRIWVKRIGHELYVYHNGELIYKRWYNAQNKPVQGVLFNRQWPNVHVPEGAMRKNEFKHSSKEQLITLLNELRAELGEPPYKPHGGLERAKRHSLKVLICVARKRILGHAQRPER